ncbi:helix-turn-helix domain-containing protein [Streptomyces sp. ISL-100]|uniref:helix-turn-helix domain-containing protein n=1 Tax=Streptomyces sp. ISL-100 TaxID=2819173 RepID=UPI001BE95AAA|nr:helix-turn-helix domain-containing protein [Streptomyces sp. ISL-100]
MREDGAVVIPAAVASEVLRALVRDLDAQVRANGGHPSPTVRRILFALHDAAQQAEASRAAPSFDSATAPFDSSATGSEPTDGATVSVTEAAQVMGCSPRHIRGLIRSGRLPATRIGARTWAVGRAALDEFRHGRGATAP